MNLTRFYAALGGIFAAAAFRLLPHPMNATPIAAMALFGGALSAAGRAQRTTSSVPESFGVLIAPFAALFLSDMIIGFHALMPSVYLAFGVTACIGRLVASSAERESSISETSRWSNLAAASIASSVLFFAATNFSVWSQGGYPHSLSGLSECYVAALPFFRNQLFGDLFFSVLLFGAWRWAESRVPQLRLVPVRLISARSNGRSKREMNAQNSERKGLFDGR